MGTGGTVFGMRLNILDPEIGVKSVRIIHSVN